MIQPAIYLRSQVKALIRKTGFDIVRKRVSLRDLLPCYGIDLVFDVGANVGQYAKFLRRSNYRGRVISFEPIPSVFAQLSKNAKSDPLWDTVNIGIGDYDGTATINVSKKSVFSSIAPSLPLLNKFDSDSAYIGKEEIVIRRLDSILTEYCSLNEKIFLKIDTQGYEKHVLNGAEFSLKHITGLQIEMSYFPLYSNELLIMEAIDLLAKKGYALMLLEPVSMNPQTGQLLQVDGVFFRHD